MKPTSTLFKFLAFLVFLFPSIIFSQSQNPQLDIALQYLEKNKEELKLTQADISNFKISDQYTSRHNGVTHLYLQQQHADINLQNAILNFNILSDGKILYVGNRFVEDLSSKINTTQPIIEPVDALQKVIDRFGKLNGNVLELRERIDDRNFVFKNDEIALEPIPVKLVFGIQSDKTIRLVWQVRFYKLDAQHMWNVQVDAVTGQILNYFDEVIHCNFNHPEGDCKKNHSHQPTNSNNTFTKKYNPSISELVPVMGSAYHVFPITVESPNHGDRAMIIDPSDTIASPFGWHDIDGMDGAEYTITRGNNVHAYHDIFSQAGSIGDEPDGGALLEFDYPFDIDNDTVYQQKEAAIVNLFYWNNIIHDVLYTYGFDEVSGNFQSNNYGNGGQENDHVNAEAIDGSGTNNANFFTPDDGSRPRMQMYIWSAIGQPLQPNKLIVTDTMGDSTLMIMLPAYFGASLPLTPISSHPTQVDDGVDNILDACNNIGNGSEIEGKIALIDRGFNGCQYGSQALRAQNEGAIGVIICNSSGNNSIFTMSPGDDGHEVNIPVVMIGRNDCDIIKMNLDGIELVEIGAPDLTFADPGPRGFDSDFDNGVITHEYGHGISNRLTGGPSVSNCLRNSGDYIEQAGEGWSDWFGLFMTTTADDNPNDVRGIGTYVSGQDADGDGIRNYPYSRSMTTNPHTYANLNDTDVSVPHGVGSIWAATIWDMYWNLVDVYGFDDDMYNGEGGNNIAMQLIVDGLKMQVCSPTFLDSRDAILAADIANYDGANQCLIWETFARRGLGENAQIGGIAGYEVPLSCQFRLKILKSAVEVSMAGEIVTYTLEVKNDDAVTLTNVVITDSIPAGMELVETSVSCPGSTFNNNNLIIPLGDMEPGAIRTCQYNVILADAPFSYILLDDDVESAVNNWEITTAVGTNTWSVSNDSYAGQNAWFAQNVDQTSDQRLTTTESFKIWGPNPRLSFWHRYDVEKTRDGGVVEVSKDGGITWENITINKFIKNGYSGIFTNTFFTPQYGFTGDNEGYENTIINLSEFIGEEIFFRFRLTSNESEGIDGWYVDNIQLFGADVQLTNIACVSSDLNENYCSEFTTHVFGDAATSSQNIESNFGVTIFPNPTDGKVYLELKNQENSPTTFSLFSLDGRMLKAKTVGNSNGIFDFNLGEFPKGIYMMQIQNEQTQVMRKVVLQ